MELQDEIARLQAEFAEAMRVITELRARIAELERTKTPPPSWVRPNRPKKADLAGPRRTRAAEQNNARRRGMRMRHVRTGATR